MSFSRREFLESTALGGLAAGSLAGAASGNKLPTRVLGKTGARVSILAFGGGSRFLSIKDEEKAAESLNHALDLGISYIDTSDDYGNGVSEQWIGKVLKARGRKGLFLATKVSKRNPKTIRPLAEASLKNLQIDQLDLIHIHALRSQEDLAGIEAKGGVLDELIKLKEQKLTRFIGITCHADPAALQQALERHDFDCTQMALNAAMAAMRSGRTGMVPDPAVRDSFENTALPVAIRKKMGVIAMKVFAQDSLNGQAEASPRNLMYYSLSLPVATAVVGMPKLEHVDENVRLARAFKPLAKSKMKELSGVLSDRNKSALDRYFRDHLDA